MRKAAQASGRGRDPAGMRIARSLLSCLSVALVSLVLLSGAWGAWGQSPPEMTSFTNRPAISNYVCAIDLGTWSMFGLNERMTAANATNTVSSYCGSQQAFLGLLKTNHVGLQSAYVNHTVTTGDDLTAWFASTGSSNFPMWTETGIVASLNLPTNYFAWTAWGDLDTDTNGWCAMTNVVRTLAWTKPESWWAAPPSTYNDRLYQDDEGGIYHSNWLAAKTVAETHYSDWCFAAWPYKVTEGFTDGGSPPEYAAFGYTHYGYLVCTASTAVAKAGDFYWRGITWGLGWLYATYVFDDNGDGITTNWSRCGTTSDAGPAFSNLCGDTSLAIGEWVDQPTGTESEARGYDSEGAVVARWTGFQYK